MFPYFMKKGLIIGVIILVVLIILFGIYYSVLQREECIYEINEIPLNEIPMYGEIEKSASLFLLGVINVL